MKDDENEYWDRIADGYADEIMAIQPEFYHNSGALLDRELMPSWRVADIGNGGVINYGYRHLEKLDCIDLSPSATAAARYSGVPNVEFTQGNVFHLDGIDDGTYDAVILQCVIHHLAGDTFSATRDNTIRALRECHRILRPGGKLLIVESTVSPWFEKIERALYPLMQAFFKAIRFDAVYQWSAPSLIELVGSLRMGEIRSSQPIEMGRWMWLLKKKVPNKITPCGAVWICLQKGQDRRARPAAA